MEQLELKNLMGALLKAKTQMGKLLKDSKNPHFKSSYASLAAVIETITAPLLESGIVLVESSVPDVPDGFVAIDVTLFHPASGESITYRSPVMPVAQRTPQGIGSAITYARRYHLMTVMGLAPEDDDGNDASSKGQQGNSGRTQTPPAQQRNDTTNGNGKPTPPPPVTDVTPTNGNGNGHKTADEAPTVEMMSKVQQERLNGLGRDFYGGEWDRNRHRLVMSITKGRSGLSKDLTYAEADKLINGLQAKINERDAALAEALANPA